MANSKIETSETLLWTNPSPTTSFAATTLNIDISKYKFLMFVMNWYANGAMYEVVTQFVENSRSNLVSVAKDVNAIRHIDLTRSGEISIDDGFEYRLGGGYGTENKRLVPIEIWGVN